MTAYGCCGSFPYVGRSRYGAKWVSLTNKPNSIGFIISTRNTLFLLLLSKIHKERMDAKETGLEIVSLWRQVRNGGQKQVSPLHLSNQKPRNGTGWQPKKQPAHGVVVGA